MTDERTVRCPVEGCDKEVLARGVHLHVRRSAGDGHGPVGEVPDHISFETLDTVGAEQVEMDYPDERDTDQHARLCPYCNQAFSGSQGLMIHLGQTAGKRNHPPNPKDRHDLSDFPRVVVDEDGNIIQATDTMGASTDQGEKGVVSLTRVFGLIAELVADGEQAMANRVRSALLASDEKEFTHPELLTALLERGRADTTDDRVNLALESGTLIVEYQGVEASLSAAEAHALASRLETAATQEDWESETMADVIRHIRGCAAVMNNNETLRQRMETFDLWRKP